MTQRLITRSEARLANLSKYFTGEPCKNGHVAERYTVNGNCEECLRVTPKPVSPEQTASRQERESLRARELALQEEKLRLRTLERQDRQAAEERRAADREARSVVNEMIRIRTLCPDRSIRLLRDYAVMLARLRAPEIRPELVTLPTLTPGRPGGFVGRYTLACFPEDRQQLVEFAVMLMSTEVVNATDVTRDRDARNAQARAAAETPEEWPEETNN